MGHFGAFGPPRDEHVADTIRLVFAKFRKSGRARQATARPGRGHRNRARPLRPRGSPPIAARRRLARDPRARQVWLVTGHTDMRKGFDGLALMAQEKLKRDLHGGYLFVFRRRHGQPPTFCIPLSFCDDRLSLASIVRADVAGCIADSYGQEPPLALQKRYRGPPLAAAQRNMH
jgi:IS66 Orf2 like protein